MYTTEDITQTIGINEMLAEYVNEKEFIKYCKACANYKQKWSCPDYDFSPMNIWQKYDKLFLLGRKIIYDESLLNKTYSPDEIKSIMNDSLTNERSKLDEIILTKEKTTPNSLALYAGSCTLCPSCTRSEQKPCRFPEKMRYSVESLGGNAALLTEQLLNVPLKWGKDGKLPEYFTLVCGLLYKENENDK